MNFCFYPFFPANEGKWSLLSTAAVVMNTFGPRRPVGCPSFLNLCAQNTSDRSLNATRRKRPSCGDFPCTKIPGSRAGRRGGFKRGWASRSGLVLPFCASFREEKRTQTQTFGSGYLPLGWGFHVKGWGPKSSICPSKQGKSSFFGVISRDFAGISRKCPKSLRKKSLCSIFVP